MIPRGSIIYPTSFTGLYKPIKTWRCNSCWIIAQLKKKGLFVLSSRSFKAKFLSNMDGKDKDFNEGGNEPWSYSNYERQCIEQVETQPDFDEQAEEKEQAVQRLWNAFQNAAMACAQLYKGL
jgi:hypothetical protein